MLVFDCNVTKFCLVIYLFIYYFLRTRELTIICETYKRGMFDVEHFHESTIL